MKITKYGHSCLLIEEKGVRILLDPGLFSTVPNSMKADALLITHEHPDHLHVETITNIVKKNPNISIYSNESVVKILDKNNIKAASVKDSQKLDVKGIPVEVAGRDHAQFYPSIPAIPNVGYFIAERFFYAGDAFTTPPKKVEILAMPVAGLFMKIAESIDYARKLKPKVAIPVHEGVLKAPTMAFAPTIPKAILEAKGIQYMILDEQKPYDF